MTAAIRVPEPLPSTLAGEAAAVMADALSDKPAYYALAPGDGNWRRASITFLLLVNIRAALARSPSSVRCVRNADGAVVAVYLLQSAAERPTDMELIRSGMLGLLWHMGIWKGLVMLWRLVVTMRFFGRVGKRAWDGEQGAVETRKKDGVLYLERVSVRRDFRCQGIGTSCVNDALRIAAERRALVRLATQEDRTARLYTRLGFKTMGESHFDALGRDNSYKSWFMAHVGGSDGSTE